MGKVRNAALGLACGLGLGAGPVAAEPLRFWHGLAGSPARYFAEAVARFAAASDEQVEVLSQVDVEVALYDQREQLTPAPDVVAVPSNFIGMAGEFGFAPVPEPELHALAKRFHDLVQLEGTTYGLPVLGSDTLLFYRNRRLAPLAPPTLAAAITSGQKLAWAMTRPFYFAPALTALGVWDEAQARRPFEPGPVTAALALLHEAYANSGQPIDCSDACAAERFLGGQAAYWIGASSARREARARLGDDLTVSVLPPLSPRGEVMTPLFGASTLVFPGGSLRGAKRRRLERLMRFFLQPDEQIRAYHETGFTPVTAAVLTPLLRQASGDDAVAFAALAAARPMPHERSTAALWPALRKVLSADLAKPLPHPAATLNELFAAYARRLEAP